MGVSAEAKYCSNCGALIPEGAMFCPKCGRPVSSASAQPPAPSRPYRYEKHEKREKGEKGEKPEKGRDGGSSGAPLGGAVPVSLAISVYRLHICSLPAVL